MSKVGGRRRFAVLLTELQWDDIRIIERADAPSFEVLKSRWSPTSQNYCCFPR
jgi:hypothetical protein